MTCPNPDCRRPLDHEPIEPHVQWLYGGACHYPEEPDGPDLHSDRVGVHEEAQA